MTDDLEKLPGCGQMVFLVASSAWIACYLGKMEEAVPIGCVNASSWNNEPS